MTFLQQIADAVLAALNTGRPAGVPEAKLWSGVALEPQDLPARTVAWTEEKSDRGGSPTSAVVTRTVTFVVQDLVAGPGSGGQRPQEICEAFRAWSIAQLVANRFIASDSLPLAIDTVETGTLWEFEQGESPFCRCTHSFEVTFTTRANNAELGA